MRIVRQLDEQRWREFVEYHPQGNIFHTPEMFRVFGRAHGHCPMVWAALRDSGEILALLSCDKRTTLGGLLSSFATRVVGSGSVLCAPGPEGQEALAHLLCAYNREMKGRILFTELRNLSDLSDLQPVLNQAGFAHEQHLNFLIDLSQNQETIWQRISHSGRQRIQSARTKGVCIEEVKEWQKIEIAYQLLEEVYERARVPLSSSTLFQAAFDILSPLGMFKVFTARINGQYAGARALLLYKGRLLDWYGGASRNFSSYSPNELLVWHTLEWAKKQGLHVFDFGGAGRPDEPYGPRKFKAKFGGQLVNYGRNTCVHAPTRLRISRIGYQLTRKILFGRSKILPRTEKHPATRTASCTSTSQKG